MKFSDQRLGRIFIVDFYLELVKDLIYLISINWFNNTKHKLLLIRSKVAPETFAVN